MLTPAKANDKTKKALELYSTIQQQVILLLAKYFKIHKGEDWNQWNVRLLKEVVGFQNEALQLISSYSGVAREELEKALNDIATETYKETLEFGKVEPSQLFGDVVQSVVQENLLDFEKGLAGSAGYGASLQAKAFYLETLRNTTLLHTVGGLTLQEAVNKAVLESYEKGLPSNFVDKGGRRWDVESYTKQAIRTSAQKVWNSIRAEGMKELGTTTVYVPPHAKARPECSRCQGKYLDIRPIGENTSKHPSVYEFGYGTPSGHRGCNCTHIWVPVVEGVNVERENPWTPQEAEQAYWEDQRYKTLARRIKKTKERIEILEALGEDTKHYKTLLGTQKQVIQAYCKEHDIRRRGELERAGVLSKKRARDIKKTISTR